MFGMNYIENGEISNGFELAKHHRTAIIYVDDADYAGVKRAVQDLRDDIQRVTGNAPQVTNQESSLTRDAVIIGTIGKSPIIDRWIADGLLDVDHVAGHWESFVIQTVDHPLPGVAQALIIAGSDKRGTIFGIYDVSEKIGVSPWYWWADVPTRHQEILFVKPGIYKQGEPSVKYRGIFLNDEGPSLMAWVRNNYRDFVHEFYEKVFELTLRLKANYHWPAMWDNTFYEDDDQNAAIADLYGVVMGTSHHEPMMRPHGDWKTHKQGPWDYSTNEEYLYKFWEEGIKRSKNYESIVTLGMRGDGDEAMGGHLTFEEKIELLQKIVTDQRQILAEHMNPNVAQVPQLWALYKEVQDYYENGMRVPDDITLLWSDDNHGNLRRVPTAEERARTGGAGIYYHLDYVGGPRSYKWVNTVPLPKIWEQMHKAYEYGADRIWILNVGDLKPMEFQLEYFLRMAWNIHDFTRDNTWEYSMKWAERQFGAEYAEDIAAIITQYAKFNGRLKPELINDVDLYSQIHYQEADTVYAEFQALSQLADHIYTELPERLKDAFFQIVAYPAKASAKVMELYILAERSRLYAEQGRTFANVTANQAQMAFAADAELTFDYNHRSAFGKWNHMMDQTHIGYTYWNHPPENIMPEVGHVVPMKGAVMRVAIEGSRHVWPDTDQQCLLPQFDAFNQQRSYIDIFNQGDEPFTFTVKPSANWIKPDLSQGFVIQQKRLWIEIDWEHIPKGDNVAGGITIIGHEGTQVNAAIEVFNPANMDRPSLVGHIEGNGYISIEAEHYTDKHDARGAGWQRIDGYGRTLSSMAVFPVTVSSVIPPAGTPYLEYRVYIVNPGELEVTALLAPSLDFVEGQGLRLGISFDHQDIQVVDAVVRENGGFNEQDWSQSVIYNIRKVKTSHHVKDPGYHILKIWMVDPIVVLQKLLVNTGGLQESYLGPEESYYGGKYEASIQDQQISFDPFLLPGTIEAKYRSGNEYVDVEATAGENLAYDVFVATSGLYDIHMLHDGDSGAVIQLAFQERIISERIVVDGAAAAACGVYLEEGNHDLHVHVREGSLNLQSLKVELVEEDVFVVRPSLRLDSTIGHQSLVAQIGILNRDVYSHRMILTVNLFDDKGRDLGFSTVTGWLARSSWEMVNLVFAAAGHTSAYRLQVEIRYGEAVREYSFYMPPFVI